MAAPRDEFVVGLQQRGERETHVEAHKTNPCSFLFEAQFLLNESTNLSVSDTHAKINKAGWASAGRAGGELTWVSRSRCVGLGWSWCRRNGAWRDCPTGQDTRPDPEPLRRTTTENENVPGQSELAKFWPIIVRRNIWQIIDCQIFDQQVGSGGVCLVSHPRAGGVSARDYTLPPCYTAYMYNIQHLCLNLVEFLAEQVH